MERLGCIIVLFFGIVNVAIAAGVHRPSDAEDEFVTISLFATDLSGCNELDGCDPYVKIMCASISSDWKECGRTSTFKNDNYPVWPEKFNFTIVPSDELRWRFDIMDSDLIIDDQIGTVSTSLREFLDATAIQPTQRHTIPNGHGFLYVHKRS